VKTIPIPSLKVSVVFKAGSLLGIPSDGAFLLDLGGALIAIRVNGKAARKLASWKGSAVLQGRLVVEDGLLVLHDAGFTLVDPKAVEVPASE
jgi:hypothetical protein